MNSPRLASENDRNGAVLTKEARVAFIRKARVWSSTDVSTMNLRDGPGGSGAFHPNELVTCDYVERKMPGSTAKFYCAVQPDDIVKVRYGRSNGEVQGSVLATRLLWALGFAADRVYPVRVRCRGCTSDPWNNRERVDNVHEFDPAVIERPPDGHEMREGSKDAEWAWPELDLVDAAQGGAPLEQLDALRLLAVFIQHTDTKPKQQRLLCLPGGLTADGACERPFLLLHDVGVTFGHANEFNRNKSGSVNLEEWAATPVWKNAAQCIGHLSKSKTGTLENPHISEAGRRFLAALLVQLTDVSCAICSRWPAWIGGTWERMNARRTCGSTTGSRPSKRSATTSSRIGVQADDGLLPGLLSASESEIQRGDDEEVQQRRGDQAAEDDDRHRMLDLVAGLRAAEHDRHQRQAGGERGHQDRREPFLGAAQHQVAAERHPFLDLEMPVVADQHDAVARGDAEDGDESDERSERQHAAGQRTPRRWRRRARTAA